MSSYDEHLITQAGGDGEEADLVAKIEAMPCEMYHEQPFDFAYCVRHDTTFALGDVCKFHRPTP